MLQLHFNALFWGEMLQNPKLPQNSSNITKRQDSKREKKKTLHIQTPAQLVLQPALKILKHIQHVTRSSSSSTSCRCSWHHFQDLVSSWVTHQWGSCKHKSKKNPIWITTTATEWSVVEQPHPAQHQHIQGVVLSGLFGELGGFFSTSFVVVCVVRLLLSLF